MDFEYVTEPKYDIKLNGAVGVDIESNGLDFRKSTLLLIQVSDGNNTYVLDARRLPTKYIKWFLNLIDSHYQIYHNGKFDIKFLLERFDYKPEKAYDSMLAEALLVAGQRSSYISLKEVVKKYLGKDISKEERASFLDPSISFTKDQLTYAAIDAKILVDLYEQQKKEIKKMGLTTTANLEFNLLPVVAKMEVKGVGFSPERLLPIIKEYEKKADRHEKNLYEIAGREFNPRSPKQVKEVFQELGVDLDSTAKQILQRLDHPLGNELLEYRKAQTLVSRYGPNLIEQMEDDGRIHAEFNQLGAASGRFSSSGPNMQNIPGEERFRHVFTARPGYKFITSDFSQIELRLAGILSGEEAIIEEYHKKDADMHRLTASKIFEKDPMDITKKERNFGKTGNFSALYGVYYKNLSKRLQIDVDLAEKIVNGFWRGYPKLQQYMDSEGDKAIRDGYNRTEIGRIRWYNVPSSTDKYFKYKYWRIKREASNNKIQGFAADIMKYAIVNVDRALQKNNLGDVVLTVHDEVGVEVKEDYLEECIKIVRHEMERSASIMVKDIIPMPASIDYGDSWTK